VAGLVVRWAKRASLVGGALLIVMQLVPVSRTNPPVEGDIAAPEPVAGLLRTACYDCHSNETVWPWYSRVAPVKFLVVHDVDEGREHLNFSTWNRLDARHRDEALEHLVDEVSEGKMPLPIYLPAHPEARLSETDRAAIVTWARTLRASGN
jgi:Haem-binding domain